MQGKYTNRSVYTSSRQAEVACGSYIFITIYHNVIQIYVVFPMDSNAVSSCYRMGASAIWDIMLVH